MKKNKLIKNFAYVAISCFLVGCSGFFDKDNTPTPTPLTQFPAEIKPHLLWSTRAGSSVDEYLKLNPASNGSAIFTSSTSGLVTSTNQMNGNRYWQVNLKTSLTTGPGVGDGIVVVGTRHGEVIALNQSNGQVLWKNQVLGELLSSPAVNDGIVVVKAVNGYVQAFSVKNGEKRWAFQQVEPALMLYGSSAPLIKDQTVLIGFANGNLVKLGLNQGQLYWIRPVAVPEGLFTIQRMIDIDADLLVYNHQIYAATYQGKIAAFDWGSGNTFWSHDISSYTGMVADENMLYISDASGHLYAFNADSGQVSWRQPKLEYRTISAPANMGNYIVVGDAEGYLHWLDKRDGHFVARESAGSGIYAKPIVQNGILYVLTNNGNLLAYQLNR